MTRLLGAGAFAWVYEAVDLDLQIPVALKVLRPEFAGQPAAEARFRKEATTAARLRHPNIVFIRDVGESEGTVFVAMDLLPLSLARRLEVLPRLPEAEVVRFALDVAAALSIAHADGIVHRDIKPDNVMLGSNGEAIVADFGLADAFSTDGEQKPEPGNTGKVMGTPHYFSPEQARGLVLDGRTDLYSLGVMCYRAATGTLPFEGEDWYSVARQHVEDPPVPPRMLVPELTEAFDAIVLRLLAKQPEQRFPSATALADALLMLPTAPVSRTVGLAPNDASVTQVAFPYVHSVVAPIRKTWRRNAAVIVLLVAASTAFAFVAVPTLNPFRSIAALPDSGSAEAPVPAVDSALAPPDDSVVTTAPDSSKPAIQPIRQPTSNRPLTPVRPPSTPSRVHVTLSAPDSAKLTINEQVVARGHWEGELTTGREYRLRARLDPTLSGCKSAEVDSTVTFTNVTNAHIELGVASCAVLLLSVRAPDATYTLNGRDVPDGKVGRYLGKPTPIVVRQGFYELQVHTERCVDYSDTVTIRRNLTTGSDTTKRDIQQICGDFDDRKRN